MSPNRALDPDVMKSVLRDPLCDAPTWTTTDNNRSAVEGIAQSGIGGADGVFRVSNGSSGTGISGLAGSFEGVTYGVRGTADSSSGTGTGVRALPSRS